MRLEAFQPYAQAFVDEYKNIEIIKDGLDMNATNEVILLVNYLKADSWTNIVNALGSEGSALVPLLTAKNNIETFLTIPLVAKAGLSFPGVIIPVVAGLSTYVQSKIMMLMNPTQNDPNNPAAAMTKSMLYVMPVMMGVFAIGMPAGLGLYWTVSNIFGILQQAVLQKHFKKKFEEEAQQNG